MAILLKFMKHIGPYLYASARRAHFLTAEFPFFLSLFLDVASTAIFEGFVTFIYEVLSARSRSAVMALLKFSLVHLSHILCMIFCSIP